VHSPVIALLLNSPPPAWPHSEAEFLNGTLAAQLAGSAVATALVFRRFAMRKGNGLQGLIGADAVVLGPQRRPLLLGSLATLTTMLLLDEPAHASLLDPAETQITLPDAIKWSSWSGLPKGVGDMAPLYGDLNATGPYLVLMRWHPGYMSAPHTYATDRLSLVLSGTWWVNSGGDFDPANTVPVPAGGFVRRVAGTPHYDGVRRDAKQPAVIALFGIGPVDFHLVEPGKPAWRRV
jgi:hypothetical protein